MTDTTDFQGQRSFDLNLLYSQIPLWPAMKQLWAAGDGFYLVGGSLRNVLTGNAVSDWDFAVDGDVRGFCRDLAQNTDSHLVALDTERDIYRIIPRKGHHLHLDFARIRGGIRQDLHLRDFTLNAMAFNLMKGIFIDPTGGFEDIKRGILRAAGPSSIEDDPLRILRAYRMISDFSLKMDKQTREQIDIHREKLLNVAWERIRDELVRILESGHGFAIVQMLENDGILRLLFPELNSSVGMSQNHFHKYDVFNHSLQTLHEIEKLINSDFSVFLNYSSHFHEYSDFHFSSGITMKALLKLAALFHDVGKPDVRRIEDGKLYYQGHHQRGMEIWRKIGRRMKLSNTEIFAVGKMIYQHLSPVWIPLIEDESRKKLEIYNFFKDSKKSAPGVLLLSWADVEAGQGKALTKEMVDFHHAFSVYLSGLYFNREPLAFPPVLVNGLGIMEHLGIEMGPMVGQILEKIALEAAMGNITDKEEACALMEKIVSDGSI